MNKPYVPKLCQTCKKPPCGAIERNKTVCDYSPEDRNARPDLCHGHPEKQESEPCEPHMNCEHDVPEAICQKQESNVVMNMAKRLTEQPNCGHPQHDGLHKLVKCRRKTMILAVAQALAQARQEARQEGAERVVTEMNRVINGHQSFGITYPAIIATAKGYAREVIKSAQLAAKSINSPEVGE